MSTYLKTIREFYGISQDDLAAYFSVSRTHLSMTEIDSTRTLPTAAMLKITRLLPELVAPATAMMQQQIHEEQEQQAKEAKEFLLKSIQTNQVLLASAQQKLATMQAREQQALHLLQLVSTEKELVSSELEKAVLNKLERDAWKALDKFGRHTQAVLKLKIKTLESAIQWAEQE